MLITTGTIEKLFQKDVSKYIGLLTKEEESLYIGKAQSGCKDSMDIMVGHNIGLVHSAARKRSSLTHTDYMDMVGQGVLGLMRAVRGFELERNLKFSTYAVPWIKQYIGRYIEEHENTIRLPSHVYQELMRLKHYLSINIGTHSNKHLMEVIGCTENRIKALLNHLSTVASLHQPIEKLDIEQRQELMINVITQEDELSTEDIVQETQNKELLTKVLSELNNETRYIIETRYGLNGREVLTLEHLANLLGLTRETVRNREKKGLRKLRLELKLESCCFEDLL